jgi:diadenosine tetraphosphate (Ap4A) HIT family hydrolase
MFVVPEKAQPRKYTTKVGARPWYHTAACFICRKQEGIEAPPAGGYIVEGKYFLVEHAPLKMSHVGTVIIQSRRHLLDFGDMNSAESTEFGSIMRKLVPAVKAVTRTDRIYYLSVNEHAPHFHLWLVPKIKGTKLDPLPFLSRRAVPATKSGAAAISRKIRRQYDRS